MMRTTVTIADSRSNALAYELVELATHRSSLPYDIERTATTLDATPNHDFGNLVYAFITEYRNTFDPAHPSEEYQVVFGIITKLGCTTNSLRQVPTRIVTEGTGYTEADVINSVFVRLQEAVRRKQFKQALEPRRKVIQQSKRYLTALDKSGSIFVGYTELGVTTTTTSTAQVMDWVALLLEKIHEPSRSYRLAGHWALCETIPRQPLRVQLYLMFDYYAFPHNLGPQLAQQWLRATDGNGILNPNAGLSDNPYGFLQAGMLNENRNDIEAQMIRLIRDNSLSFPRSVDATMPFSIGTPPKIARPPKPWTFMTRPTPSPF